MPKKPIKQNANAIADLFAGEISNEAPPTFAEIEPAKTINLVMPDRGYLYSEQWRQECELMQLSRWQQTMSFLDWDNLWKLIGIKRGQASANALYLNLKEYQRKSF